MFLSQSLLGCVFAYIKGHNPYPTAGEACEVARKILLLHKVTFKIRRKGPNTYHMTLFVHVWRKHYLVVWSRDDASMISLEHYV